MEDDLNLDELAQFCDDLRIDDSAFSSNERGYDGSLHIGGYQNGEYRGVGSIDYVPTDRGEKLVKLLETLPRLIALCKDQAETIAVMKDMARD